MQGVQNLNMNTQYEVSLREPTRWSACVISSKGGGEERDVFIWLLFDPKHQSQIKYRYVAILRYHERYEEFTLW